MTTGVCKCGRYHPAFVECSAGSFGEWMKDTSQPYSTQDWNLSARLGKEPFLLLSSIRLNPPEACFKKARTYLDGLNVPAPEHIADLKSGETHKTSKMLQWFMSKFEARQETHKLPERGPKLP